MKEYKIGELFQWEDRTLMCVEWKDDSDCDTCKLKGERCRFMSCDTVEGISIYFTNKLIFSAEGIKLQINRKGAKIKVKVLELSEEFYNIYNDEFTIYKANIVISVGKYSLGIYEVGDKIKYKFYTEQEAIAWVYRLFSLRGEYSMELKVGDKVKLIKDIEISYNGFANGGFLIPKDTILYYECKSINPRESILYSGEYGGISIPDCYFIKED